MIFRLKLNSKGYFFSLTVILLLLIVSVYFSTQSPPDFFRRSEVSSKRVVEIDNFIDSVSLDSNSALKVASIRSFISYDREILRVSGYPSGSPESFDELFSLLVVNGTYAGNNVSLLNYSSINSWASRIISLGDSLHINVTFSDFEVVVFQSDPWFISTHLISQINVYDPISKSSWVVPLDTSSSFSVSILTDPIFSINSGDSYDQYFVSSSFDSLNDDLMSHIYSHTYIESSGSPSVLDRYRGNFSSSILSYDFGIESLVDVSLMESYGLVKNSTIVDWLYFSDEIFSPLCSNGLGSLPSWVQLDVNHMGVYGLSC